MEKEIKTIKINYFLSWGNECDPTSIGKIREDLDAIEKLGATHVQIHADDEYGFTNVFIEAVLIREETDAEARLRLIEERRRIIEREQIEKREFERLKKKFGL